ncbi:MAG: hypothetical protein HY744_27350, partial [Deltaproteobacteria bacterium]|nr:hypothetical protein [Deltaproteobacteria bacterium]
AGGTTKCGSKCVDTAFDLANCGGCGKACGPGEICSAGQCALECTGGTVKCGNKCVDTAFDPANCGSCGKACGPNEACAQGKCTSLCPQPLVMCNNVCTNTAFDPANCGSCGKICAGAPGAAAVCAKGVCGIVCAAGRGNCNGSDGDGCEIDLSADVNNCGLCANKCPAVANGTAACAGGKCGVGQCNANFADCDKNAGNGCEVSLQADAKNCGSCGNACPGGQMCNAGVCTACVLITSNDGYGHHGNCGGWNGCGNAATCAQWACEVKGYKSMCSFGKEAPCNSGQFSTCHLFYSQGNIQWNWGTGCAVMGVGDIKCKN